MTGWVSLPEPEMPPAYDEIAPPKSETVLPEEEPGNVDDTGVAHFGVIPPGMGAAEFCGGCGEAWPCAGAETLGMLLVEGPSS